MNFDLRQWSGFIEAGGDHHSPAIVQNIVIDSRRVGPEPTLFVALSGEVYDGHDFVAQAALQGAQFALVKPDWPAPVTLSNIQLLRVENPLKALQQIAGQYRKSMKTPILAITGSQGKTMLKDMLQAVIGPTVDLVVSPESFNSQIGVALSLLNIRAHHKLAIIEAGISQVDEMDCLATMISPEYVILTTLDPRHVATLPNQTLVAAEKSKLVQQIPIGGWALVPDDVALVPHLQSVKGSLYFWNRETKALPHATPCEKDHSHAYRVRFPDGTENEGRLCFGYTYMLDLITIAAKAAWLLGIPSEMFMERLADYVPESMRTELWRTPSGVTLISTPYCADPQSIDIGLAKLQETPTYSRKLFVFGGIRKATLTPTDVKRISYAIHRAGIHRVYLHTDLAGLRQHLEQIGVEISHHSDRNEALQALKSTAHHGDHVLVMGPSKISLEHLMELFDDGVAQNLCFINLATIQHNLGILRARLHPNTRIMVIVKALAYGTEEVRMGRFLASFGIDILGVSYVEEGVALKRAGVNQAVFALNVTRCDMRKAVRWELEVGVHTPEIIDALAVEASTQGKVIKVHLHVDTGMGRLGCRSEDALALAQSIQSHPSLKLEGLMTHFSSADDPEQDPYTFDQARQLESVHKQLMEHEIPVPYVHAANSAAVLRHPALQYQMVRIGLALYGLHASPATRNQANEGVAKLAVNLKLAISLTSRIVGINTRHFGESVSYGRRYTVQNPIEKIAVIPIGYFDGLHRHYSGKGWVMIKGQRAPMVGTICMDYLMVNITEIPEAKVGDPVLVLGQDEYGQTLQPEELADQGGSIVHELICCLGPRIQRIFIYE